MEAIPVLFYGSDMRDHNGHIECGPETKARINKGAEYINQYPKTHFIIFLAAGVPPRRPQVGLMRNHMKKYLEALLVGENFEIILVPQQVVFGSFEETLACVQALLGLHMKIREIILVSTDRHMFRIKLGWFFLSRNTKLIPITCTFLKQVTNLNG